MKRLVIAIHKITHTPSGRMRHNGKYDPSGNPILQLESESIMPGTLFEKDDQDRDFARLVNSIEEGGTGAIEIVEDPAVIALWEAGHPRDRS